MHFISSSPNGTFLSNPFHFVKISFFILNKALSVLTGEPSYELMESHPDWKPSLRLGHCEMKATNSVRFVRQQDRGQMKRDAVEKAKKEAEEKAKMEADERAHKEAEERTLKEAEERARQEAEEREEQERLALIGEDEAAQGEAIEEKQEEADNECDFCKLRQSEINRLLEENRNLKKELEQRKFTDEFIKEDDVKVGYRALPRLLFC